MRDLLCYLKVTLDEPQDNIISVLDTFVVDGNLKNDDIKAVSNFFTNVYLKSPEDIERDIVLQLLKAITNQAFVAPAYWALKTKVSTRIRLYYNIYHNIIMYLILFITQDPRSDPNLSKNKRLNFQYY
jgi:hypothetical protein